MLSNGISLRERREELGLSQARLAEIAGVPQHLLSSFELEKTEMSSILRGRLVSVLANANKVQEAVSRRKRYTAHSYSVRSHDLSRVKRHAVTAGNASYVAELAVLRSGSARALTGLCLFSGIGGFSLGFKAAGFQIKGFVEIDDDVAAIYQANFPDVPRMASDITQITDDDLADIARNLGNIDVMIGGPPCQGFSLSGKRKVEDARNELFRDYMRFVDALSPKVAIIENVRLLTSMKGKNGRLVKDEIAQDFRDRGYNVDIFEINAKYYGVPQHRERVLFVAYRDDLKHIPDLPARSHGVSSDLFGGANHCRTFGDACSDLEFLEAGEGGADPHHVAVKHPDHVIDWLWDVPEGSSAHDNADPALRPPSGYNTTYKRQVWNEVASTVQTTFGMISGCRNVHPIATRSLTIREAARIQSFPDDFELFGKLGTVRTGLGNAVPPLLAKAVAEHLRDSVFNFVEVASL
ncbi:MAG: DNA (cytosine-5-)-methyltransferase [Sphingobium phenoxybenzoativorans]